MLSNAEKVKIMMLRFGQEVKITPAAPDPHVLALRANLIKEEYEETMEALELVRSHDAGTLEHLAKELCDLLVVTYGTLHAFGINPDIAFDAVNESNMSKLNGNGKPNVREDGKVLKGARYRKPEMGVIWFEENV